MAIFGRFTKKDLEEFAKLAGTTVGNVLSAAKANAVSMEEKAGKLETSAAEVEGTAKDSHQREMEVAQEAYQQAVETAEKKLNEVLANVAPDKNEAKSLRASASAMKETVSKFS